MSQITGPPYWGPPPPQYSAPPPPQPTPRPRARWLPGFVGGVAVGAVVAAAVAVALTAQRAGPGPDSVAVAPVTVTATPPAPPPPMLTTAEADRQTCQTYSDIGDALRSATETLQIIPADMTILAPEVRANSAWSAAVQRAADFYGQAATRQVDGIAAGSTPALNQAAVTFSDALETMSIAYRTYDAAVGDIYATGQASDGAMAVLCNRLAPR